MWQLVPVSSIPKTKKIYFAFASELILKGTHTHTDVNTHKSDGKSGLMGLCISLSQASGTFSAASHSLKDGNSPSAAQYRWIMRIPLSSSRTFPVFECSINILTNASLLNLFGEALNDWRPSEAHHAASVRAADGIVVPVNVMCSDYLIKRFSLLTDCAALKSDGGIGLRNADINARINLYIHPSVHSVCAFPLAHFMVSSFSHYLCNAAFSRV